MNNKIIILIVLNFFFISNSFSLINPNYPDTKEGFKGIDYILPKIGNSDDYKVEIAFSLEFDTIDQVRE